MISPSSRRLEFVDSLRGFALFGVFAANLLIFSGIVYLTDAQRAILFTSPLDSVAYSLERFFIENKFMGLFSFLFGVSFWLFLSRAGPGLMGQVSPSALAVIAIAGYAAQIVIARAWLARFRFGPAEWLWRSLTYGERQPFKLSSPAPVRVQA